MADETQVSRLLAGIDGWNSWRQKEPKVQVNLISSDLREADLSEADLSEADFSEANFMGANLIGADLSRTNLNGANLFEANLSWANLRGANLSETILGATFFGDTNFGDGADLMNCVHHGPSVIDHSTLTKSGMLPVAFLRGCGLPERLIDHLPSYLGDATAFYSCFISYSHADKVFARRLHDQLQGKGIRCWLDEHQMLAGDDIYEQVDIGIRVFDKVLLCCSEASLTSWWVDNEIDTTFEKERKLMRARDKKVLALIPLDLDGYVLSDNWKSGKSRQVKARMAANFNGWEHNNEVFENAFEALVNALKTDNRGRASPPASKL